MPPGRDQFAERLIAAGFTEEEAVAKSRDHALCNTALDAAGASTNGRLSAWTPGRIEVFGKHTDRKSVV